MSSVKVQHNVSLSAYGRKDLKLPPQDSLERYNKYRAFPIDKLVKPGYSFIADEEYEYGKTISIKNACRTKARKLFKNKKIPSLYTFAVREWHGKIRVWRTK